MALDAVPLYLVEAARRTEPLRLAQFVETGDGVSSDEVYAASAMLRDWVEDREYWDAVAE